MMAAPLITSFYPFTFNYAVKLFIDIMSAQKDLAYKDVLFPLCLFIGNTFSLSLVWRISNVAEWMAEPYVRQSLLLRSYDYVQHHSYVFFQNNFTGAISSKLKGILDGYDTFWAEMHHGFMAKSLKVLISFGTLFLVNTKLGLFMFMWGAVYVPTMYKLSLRLNQLSFEETESRHALIGQISDKVTNILSLFAFASRQREFKTLEHQIATDFVPRQIKTYKYHIKIQIIADCLYVFMFSFLVLYMVHLRKHNAISLGDFAFVFGLILMVSEDLWAVTISLQDFSRSMGDLKSALSLLYIPQEAKDAKNARPLVVQKPSIVFRHVKFGYHEKDFVFKDLNLTLRAGEKIGFVGHSGAGKSSLVNLLLRYFTPQGGEILIDGQDIAKVTQDSLRENVAVIPQDTLLFHRTLMENILYGNPNATEEEVIEASKKAHIHAFILTLPEHYNTYVGERGIKLSGGQRQRIAIARAILKDAPILVLDEATASLDSETEKHIQDSLNFLMEKQGKTVLAIAHRLSTLKHMDRILVLDKGVIVEEGPHEVLMQNKNSLYKKLWKLQEI